MTRPTTKAALLDAAQEQFIELWNLIDRMTDSQKNAAFNFLEDFQKKEAHWARDKNLRDVLVHLHEWHQLFLHWVKSNQNGTPVPFLPQPYNWKTYGEMNVVFWEKHQNTTLKEAMAMLQKSHTDCWQLITQFSDEELFVKKYFSWTGTTTLGSYGISATASHYDWALKKLKWHLKTC